MNEIVGIDFWEVILVCSVENMEICLGKDFRDPRIFLGEV